MDSKVIEKIRKAMLQRRETFETDGKFAKFLGINSAIWNRIKSGDVEKVLSVSKWYNVARLLDVQLADRPEWITAKTPVFIAITSLLSRCQAKSISLMLCDIADIGKTYTAKEYVKTNKNAVYIDCSQSKSKQRLIRSIARSFGVDSEGRYADVYEDLVFFIKSQSLAPIVILDEAGDLEYSAFLELKALWNATEGFCSWFMMGADGLKEKIRRAISCKKVGYTEMFSRFGSRYQRVTPEAKQDRDMFFKAQAQAIIAANSSGVDVNKIIANTDGSLRRIQIELAKKKGA